VRLRTALTPLDDPMPNEEHVAQLLKGAISWNAWREKTLTRPPELHEARLRKENLSGANLSEADFRYAHLNMANLSGANLENADLRDAWLQKANFRKAYLREARLSEADLRDADLVEALLWMAQFDGADLRGAKLAKAKLGEADLRNADLSGADLSYAQLGGVKLSGAKLTGAKLTGADLFRAEFGYTLGADLSNTDLTGADLTGANLQRATLVNTDLTDANLTGCRIYGVSAWGLKLHGAKQQNLIITGPDEPEITVDNIEVAQFIYLLLHNEKIRDVIDTIGRKGVLLLGRFTEGRIEILKRLREELRNRGYLPIIFNFDKPETKDFTETVRLLAGLSKFVIADVTNPKSAPLELQAAVPEIMVPFRPIIEEGEHPFAMLQDLWIKHRDWVFEPIYYSSLDALIAALDEKIIRPAEARFTELLARKAEKMKGDHV
jgi:uncharacterized protein YjbI with pentapeptide repeats